MQKLRFAINFQQVLLFFHRSIAFTYACINKNEEVVQYFLNHYPESLTVPSCSKWHFLRECKVEQLYFKYHFKTDFSTVSGYVLKKVGLLKSDNYETINCASDPSHFIRKKPYNTSDGSCFENGYDSKLMAILKMELEFSRGMGSFLESSNYNFKRKRRNYYPNRGDRLVSRGINWKKYNDLRKYLNLSCYENYKYKKNSTDLIIPILDKPEISFEEFGLETIKSRYKNRCQLHLSLRNPSHWDPIPKDIKHLVDIYKSNKPITFSSEEIVQLTKDLKVVEKVLKYDFKKYFTKEGCPYAAYKVHEIPDQLAKTVNHECLMKKATELQELIDVGSIRIYGPSLKAKIDAMCE